ncbi:MAG: biotin/lipoyl-binding protein, partial [Planctomycetaceae bacterium]|nr:biotin/lipoyl-binding protein [Planctomycetaceae bacterium]
GFQEALVTLVRDPVELVQRNAALSLSKFDDDRCKPVLLSMLEPYEVKSPRDGTVSRLLQKGQPVRASMEIGYIESSDASFGKILSPVDGAVKNVAAANGSQVSKGDAIYSISPAQQDMWEALRALLIVGDPEDIEAIQKNTDRYATTPQITEQAKETVKAIEKRATQNQDL